MAILGLMNSEDFATQREKNYRRNVFYYNPNGAFPITGLTSLLDEEETNDPQYYWWEKRMPIRATLTAGALVAGPFTNTSDVDLTAAGWTVTAEAVIRVWVSSTANFRENNVIMIEGIGDATSGTGTLYAYVKDIVGTTKLNIVVIEYKGAGLPKNGASELNLAVSVVGSTYEEGASQTSRSLHTIPTQFYNYAQIFRKPFQLTETAARTSAKWDLSGPYKDRAKEAQVDHFKELEFATLFGRRALHTGSSTKAQRLTGGIIWTLEQYEAANSDYRGGTGAAAITADSNDDKRIIENTAGTLSEKTYDTYLERVFRFNRNRASELLCVCGSGFLKVIHQMYRGQSVISADFPTADSYGMNVTKHMTPFGDVFYKTHPLFNENSTRRNWALFLDVGELKWRYLQGRDTTLRKHIENKRDDYREDEWLTEGGMEIHSPESHLLLKKVENYTP